MDIIYGRSGKSFVNTTGTWTTTTIGGSKHTSLTWDDWYRHDKFKELLRWGDKWETTSDTINVSDNYLRSLPDNIPPVRNLLCAQNFLTCLPDLPEGLELLDCSFNRLTELPTLPSTLRVLRCHGNFLKDLPNLPESLEAIEIEGNDISDELRVFLKIRGLTNDGN